MVDVATIKKAFTESFPEASYAILALAMYAAFKEGYLQGVKAQ